VYYSPSLKGAKVALALPAQQIQQASWQVEPFDVILDAVLTAAVK